MQINSKELELLHKLVRGYTLHTISKQQEALTYYQDDLYGDLSEELVHMQELVVKLYENVYVTD